MFNKFEMIGAGMSVFFMGLAIYLVQAKTTLFNADIAEQTAQLADSKTPGVIIVGHAESANQERTNAYLEAVDTSGNFKRMVIDDIKFGNGVEVKEGDTVAVHYSGTLQNGEEFDNSRNRDSTFEFTVGGGQVIKGWDEGVVGMKVGGHRVLVIPPEMAYGENGIGPIPGNATLIFTIELVEIK